ncbi:MCE family protein [Aeromicrobium panaciterrae]|uniref:MCE family protein n=1 Tax=Aeromicrobium panaciterrae TaxID=363861 RepID=UPI0031E17515
MLKRLMVIVLLLTPLTACGSSSPTVVTAQFSDAAGLFKGNDVGVLGVRVGSITAVKPKGDHVDVTLRIDGGVKIPAKAGAVIVSRSVATDRYVELTPVYDSGPVIESGTVLPMARTRTPVEFDDLLGSLTGISDQLAVSAPLNDLLATGAKTLDGNGQKIAEGMHGLADTLGTLDDATGDITGTLDNLDQLTQTLADNDALVRRFNTEVSSAASMLDDQHEAIERTFTVLSAMLQRVAAFSRDHRTKIAAEIADITELSTTLLEHRKGLEEAVSTLPLMMQNVDRAITDDRLTMRTRPGDLVPAADVLALLCESVPPAICDATDLEHLSLLDVLAALAGVKK